MAVAFPPGEDEEATSPEAIRMGATPDAPPRITPGGVNASTGFTVPALDRASMSILDQARHSALGQAPKPLNRDRVRAALAFHIGAKLPGIEWTQAIDPLATRFEELAAENPTLIDQLESDVNAMYALTDEDIALKIARGEPLSQMGDVFDAIAEVSWEVGATELATRFNDQAADVVKGQFDALTQADASAIVIGDIAPMSEQLSFSRVAPGGDRAATFAGLFDVPGAWSFSPSARTLAVTVGDQTIGIETRAGFNPDNHLDVMAEVVTAQAEGRIRGGSLTGGQKKIGPDVVVDSFLGLAHRIGSWVEQHPGATASIDQIWNAATRFSLLNLTNEATGGPSGTDPLARASAGLRDDEGRLTEQSVRMASILPFPDDAIAAVVAREWMAEMGGALSSRDALTLAGEMVEENRDQLVHDFETMTAEELLTQLEEDIEGDSAIGRALETGLGSSLAVVESWDRFAQWTGVNAFDFVLNALGEDITAEQETGQPSHLDGYERIKAMFESQPMGTMASDYFGIDDPDWADAVDIAVSMGFDLTNFAFPGARGVRAMAFQGLTNPKFGGLYLKMGQFPHIARQIAHGGHWTGALPDVLPMARASRQWAQLADDQFIEVYHATTKETAEQMSKRGIVGMEKVPGENATLLTGEGVYVGEDPDRLRFLFGGEGPEVPGTVVGIKVRKGALTESEEGARLYPDDIRGAMADPIVGARVVGDVEPQRVRILNDDDLAALASDAPTGRYTNVKGVLSVLGMSGLDDPEIIDLLKLAQDPNATVGQVNAVWQRALGKDWLGEGMMRAVRHDTVEGLGRMIDSVIGGRVDQETENAIMQYFVKADVGRTINLGENRSMDALGDLLISVFPGDPDRAARLYMEAAEARMAAGDELALAGVTAAQKESARRAAWEASGSLAAMGGAYDTTGISQNLRTLEDALSKLGTTGVDEATEAAMRTQLNNMHRVMSRKLEVAQPKMQAARDKKRLGLHHVRKATALEADMAANASRNVMAAQFLKIYEEIAQQINKTFGEEIIPVVPNKVNPLVPDEKIPVRDWRAVTGGVGKLLVSDDPDLSLMMGLAVDDVELARQADAVGMFNRSQKLLLPASPYELLLFQRLGGDRTALAKFTQALRGPRLKKLMRGMKLVFAMNLLVNPITAGKITLDPTMRFLAETGQGLKFARATAAGIPGIGRATEALHNQLHKWAARGGEMIVNPWGLPYKRNVGGFNADDFADYGWVVRPERRLLGQYAEQVERWVNGSLLSDRRFREYARWIAAADTLDDGTKIPPSGWVDFWENGGDSPRPGKADVNPTTIKIRDEVMIGNDLTAADAFNIVDRVFENWLMLVVDPKQQTTMRRRLLEAAVTPDGRLDLVQDARLLKSVSQVPGLSHKTGPGSTVFNIFFGAPASRRAGVMWESYNDYALKVYRQRFGDRILTVDKIMEYAKIDKPTAEFWLKQGSDNAIVSQLIRETGMRTEAQLAARAAQWAERRVDDLEYRFVAASLAGRGIESGLVAPFARAQGDFIAWWMDHMFKPMTTRIPLELRAKLPGIVQSAISGMESIPINWRAWAKYAHLVAAVNNDQPSVIDQTLANLTFFPLRYGSEFLIDVTPANVDSEQVLRNIVPQAGPMPAWMFDVMIDRGEAMGLDMAGIEANFEALFPALGYTDFDSSDPFGDVFDRLLPSSRRSIRDLGVGALRRAYAIGGNDVHTNPGIMGQIANILADGKLPAATGDFQAAEAADFIGEHVWDIVPGSEEWNREVLEFAIKGASEANREEWGQDIADRVFPLATYDKEYRALRAYESLLEEGRYEAMVNRGLFTGSDLFEIDGVPRIRATWEKYLRGEATDQDLAWLDDRLTTAYFEAGRVEVLPGFSYMDYLHLTSPELAVNLIQKSEDSGIPVRGGEREVGPTRLTHAEFKQRYINKLTGRLQNVPPGQDGADMRRAAFDYGWIVSRPVEEWALDAGQAVYKSGQRAVRGVWERVSHRTWQQGIKKSIEDKTFTLDKKSAAILEAAGLELEAGTRFTYGEFHTLLDDFDERFDIAQPVLIDTLGRGAVHGQLALHNDKFGLGLLEDLNDADLAFNREGIDSVEDWPEPSKQVVRDRFAEAITLGYTTLEDYEQEIEPLFGPIDYEPPVPPPVAELERGVNVTGDELDELEVIDGDTVALNLDDGPMRVRFIGINAPEATQPGHAEARGMLEAVLEGAGEVTFGVYQPEVFGVTQLTAPGERRLLAWLYVDGVPIYDPSVFTSANPRGAGVGGNVLDLPAIREAGRDAQ